MLTSYSQASIIPDEMIEDWLSVSEASERSGYDKEYIRQLCRRNAKLMADGFEPRFEAIRKGSIWLIEPESFDAYCQKMQELGTGKHDPTRRPRPRRK